MIATTEVGGATFAYLAIEVLRRLRIPADRILLFAGMQICGEDEDADFTALLRKYRDEQRPALRTHSSTWLRTETP